MWPGPYGDWGSRKYVLASLDQSLAPHGPRLRRHLLLAPLRPRHARSRRRWVRSTRRCGRARPCTPASPPTPPSGPRQAAGILRELGTPLLIHQPSYSHAQPLDRGGAARRARRRGHRLHRLLAAGPGPAHRPLPAGGIPEDSRASRGRVTSAATCSARRTSPNVRALNEIARRRGQTLAQMALAWTLRDPRVTSALIGASQRASSSRRTWPRSSRMDFSRGGARRDRPVRGGRSHQHVGALEQRLRAMICRWSSPSIFP